MPGPTAQVGLTVLMVLAACSSANTEPPFTLGGATPEMLPSLKRRLAGERRPHRRVTGPFRSAYGSGLPGRCRDGVGLSPVNAVGHYEQATSPVTPSVRRGYPHGPLRERFKTAPCFRRLGSLAPTRGRNATPPVLSLPGPSVTARCRAALAAYLFQRRVRARISGQARTRPGRIRSTFP